MEDRTAIDQGAPSDGFVSQITLDLLNAKGLKMGVVLAGNTAHRDTLFEQARNDSAADKTAASRDQDGAITPTAQAKALAAKIASFSLPILALWRISTGKLR